MGTALVQGAIEAGVLEADKVLGVGRATTSKETLEKFTKATGAKTVDSLDELVAASEVLLLCTKPQDAFAALAKTDLRAGAGKLLISVAAGVTTENLEKHTPETIRVIRTMPNTPSLVGKGAAAYCLGSRCVDGDIEIVEAILGAVGLSVSVPEKLMDAVTGVSGSGPAYIYLIIEAMADGGVAAGLPRADALRLAAQTVSGAAEMVIKTGLHPAVLKDMVTSPGGTTIAGIAALEKGNVRSAMISAVSVAKARAEELGKD